jgi:tRNA pseudouridine38-40 synthase
MEKQMYLVGIQYLGYRLHGWQRQPGVKTAQELIEKTIRFVLGHEEFKILTSSRTDAMVSVEEGAFEIFLKEKLDPVKFLEDLNFNLPADISALYVKEVDSKFNIISGPKIKEYHYHFCWGEKIHPFCAPFITRFRENLDLDLMMKGASLFEGTHNFEYYCYKPKPETNLVRTIDRCVIEHSDDLKASFFPESFYVLKVFGKGFMRHQIRLMMGALVELGAGNLSMEQFQQSLVDTTGLPVNRTAPASGLLLKKLKFEDLS